MRSMFDKLFIKSCKKYFFILTSAKVFENLCVTRIYIKKIYVTHVAKLYLRIIF